MNIFNETHAYKSSSFKNIKNTDLVCDLEMKEVIFVTPLCFDGKYQILGNNDQINVDDIEALHLEVMVMPGPHVIISQFEKNEELLHKEMVMPGRYFDDSHSEPNLEN